MKLSKQIFLTTLILFIFFVSGCSSNLLVKGDPGNKSGEIPAESELDTEFSKEGHGGEVDTPPRLYEKPDPRSFGSAEQGMPGNGASGFFSAEPFTDERGMVFQLSKKEEVRRQLAYSSSDHLQDIHFSLDKFELDDISKATLQKNITYLKAHPKTMIEIQGHCDERGSNNYNITLGDRRTQTIKSYLVFLGIDGSRIHTISYGEENPLCFESNEDCWHQNRRGHFLIAE